MVDAVISHLFMVSLGMVYHCFARRAEKLSLKEARALCGADEKCGGVLTEVDRGRSDRKILRRSSYSEDRWRKS